jgi:glycosyltransferase involved in cell wall biosynthesis
MSLRVVLDVSAVPTRPVGAGVYTIALARGLDRRDDIELHLAARADDTRWETLTPDATVHPLAPVRRPARLVWEQVQAPRLARDLAPDAWHGPHYTLPLRARVPTVVTVHDLTFFDHPEWHERSKVAYFRRMIRAATARADVVVCVSQFTADRLHAHCKPRGEVVVVPHGVDHDRFTPVASENDTAALARYGITAPFVASAGTIEPRKDLPTLVRAFARIVGGRDDLRLVLAGGDGWGSVDLRDSIAASGAAAHVLRPGYVDDDALVALFRAAEAVAYPSREEGFGLNVLEVLACGTPLVTTQGSAIEEVVDGAGLLFAPGDDEACAAALARVLDDPAVGVRLREAGLARAAEFTWEDAVAAHVDAYARAAR